METPGRVRCRGHWQMTWTVLGVCFWGTERARATAKGGESERDRAKKKVDGKKKKGWASRRTFGKCKIDDVDWKVDDYPLLVATNSSSTLYTKVFYWGYHPALTHILRVPKILKDFPVFFIFSFFQDSWSLFSSFTNSLGFLRNNCFCFYWLQSSNCWRRKYLDLYRHGKGNRFKRTKYIQDFIIH